MKINDELTKKIAKLAAEIMYSAEKEGEVRSQGEADFVNQHVDNIEVVDNRDEKLGKVEEPKEKKTEKEVKKESYCEDDMEETKMSDEEIEEALSKSTPASEWIKDFVHSKNPMFKGKSKDERIKMALGAYYAKKNESIAESTNLTEATEKISSDIWISELGNVLARAETKDLAMAFEAWANSYYKTPVWQSLVNNPLLKNLFDTMAESLDIFIGTSNEERDTNMEESESKPNSSYMNMTDDQLDAIIADKSFQNRMGRMQAERAKLAKLAKNKKPAEMDRVRSALIRKKGGDQLPLNRNSGMTESSKYVINIEGKIYSEKGKAVEFDDKEKAEKAVAKIKGHSSMTGKEVKVDNLNEESETEIAAIEKEYLAAKDKKAVLKKYDITSGISRLRPGEIKLGIRNELNGRTSFAALDTDGKLIIISGTEKAPKIRYVRDVMKKEEETSAGAIALPDVALFKRQKNEGVSKDALTEAKDYVYDYQGKDPYEFVDGFDDAEGTKVGNWMRRPEAMRKLMKAANTNSYEFKEVILPKGKENTEAEVEKQMKDKGYKLFDTGMNFGSGNLLTGPKGNYFTGLLFYKKK
jgi:hypothetical protein